MALNEDIRQRAILAAVPAAGSISDPKFKARLEDAARTIVQALEPSSPVSKTLDAITDAKKFVAVLKSVDLEQSSTRGVLTIQGQPTQYSPEGLEYARTERTDREDGQLMFDKVKALVGRRLLFYIEVETFGSGPDARKMRKVIHVEDLGVPREFPAQQASQQYQQPAAPQQPAPPAGGDPWSQSQHSNPAPWDEAPPF